MARHIVILGVSHRSAPVEIREQLITLFHERETLLVRLHGEVIQELALLNTCNRVEIVAAGDDPHAMLAALTDAICSLCGVQPSWVHAYMRSYVDRDAFVHLFRVASSLESIVVGEPQILGQVKQAFQEFFGLRLTGPLLNRAFHRAFFTAKRVRTETGIAENAVSVSYAAVQLARQELVDLNDVTVMVVGAGKMGVLAAKHLRQAGAGRMIVLNRDPSRAQSLADEVEGEAAPLSSLEALLGEADVVISSTGASQFIFTPTLMQRVRQHRHAPQLLIDIAVPRDIDPSCAQIEGVHLYDVDDLERVIDSSLDYRRGEARRAEHIVQHEANLMESWLRSLDAIPRVIALRAHFQSVLEEELARHVENQPQWTETEGELVRKFSQSLINKLLHHPTVALRDAEEEALPALSDALNAFFPLNEPEDDE